MGLVARYTHLNPQRTPPPTAAAYRAASDAASRTLAPLHGAWRRPERRDTAPPLTQASPLDPIVPFHRFTSATSTSPVHHLAGSPPQTPPVMADNNGFSWPDPSALTTKPAFQALLATDRRLLLLAVPASFIMYGILLVIYRLFFSPIAGFPGPKIAAATAWYEFYYDVIGRGKYYAKICEMHDKYGMLDSRK